MWRIAHQAGPIPIVVSNQRVARGLEFRRTGQIGSGWPFSDILQTRNRVSTCERPLQTPVAVPAESPFRPWIWKGIMWVPRGLIPTRWRPRTCPAWKRGGLIERARGGPRGVEVSKVVPGVRADCLDGALQVLREIGGLVEFSYAGGRGEPVAERLLAAAGVAGSDEP